MQSQSNKKHCVLSTVGWDVTPSGLVNSWRFGEAWLQAQGQAVQEMHNSLPLKMETLYPSETTVFTRQQA